MKKTTVIAFMLLKGGCGKSTLSVNIAHALALKKKNVLFIDADPQGNATTNLGEYDLPLEYNPAMAELFSSPEPAATVAEMFYATKCENITLVPNNYRTLNALKGKESGLEFIEAVQKFNEFKPYFPNFDFVIIDCPPDPNGILPNNALQHADYVISPIDGVYALDAITPLTSLIASLNKVLKANVRHLGYVLNKIKTHSVNAQFLSGELVSRIGTDNRDLLFKTMIPESENIKRSQSARLTVFAPPKNKIAANFTALTDEILRRIKQFDAAKADIYGKK